MYYRLESAQYIRRNKPKYQAYFETEDELNAYILMMEREHTWGGELEISIASHLHNCVFHIHQNDRPTIVVSFSQQAYSDPLLQYE